MLKQCQAPSMQKSVTKSVCSGMAEIFSFFLLLSTIICLSLSDQSCQFYVIALFFKFFCFFRFFKILLAATKTKSRKITCNIGIFSNWSDELWVCIYCYACNIEHWLTEVTWLDGKVYDYICSLWKFITCGCILTPKSRLKCCCTDKCLQEGIKQHQQVATLYQAALLPLLLL